MAERNFYGLKKRIASTVPFIRNNPIQVKKYLYDLIEDGKKDSFFNFIKYRVTNTPKASYKLILFYGLGPPGEEQSLWIKLINSKRFSWMKLLVENSYILDMQPIMTCLSHNIPISTLNYAIEHENEEAVKFLLELQSGNNSGEIKLPNLCHPMIKCVNKWKVEIADLLTQFGIGVNHANKSGNTALHIACKNANLSAVEFLLEKKAKVNVQNGKGKTPLHLAVDVQNEHIVKCLLKNGSVLMKDKFNHTPLFYAILNDNKKTERLPIYGIRSHKRNLLDSTQISSISKQLKGSDLVISDIVSMLTIDLVPLHDSDRYCDVIRSTMVAQVKHGIKPILHSQLVRYPEARTVLQVERIYDSPILQVLYSSVVWTSPNRTSISNSTMRSRLLLYVTILLNSSSLEQCYLRHTRALLSFTFQCFIKPFPPKTSHCSTNTYLTRILRQAWKEFTCLILLTQHYQMPIKQTNLEQLEMYMKNNVMPIFNTIELPDQDLESLSLPLELVCIPIHLFLYLVWQTTHQPSEHYYNTFKRIKEYIDYFYIYCLSKHDMLTCIASITCYDSHKLKLNEELHDFAGHELGNFAMIENSSFDVKITDIINFLVDMRIDTNSRSPISGDSSLHTAAKGVMPNELLHLLNVGTYPLTLDRKGDTFYQSIHDKPDSFMDDERTMILSHPSIEGLAPPKLETLCALTIAKNYELCQYATFDYFPNTRFSKLIYLHLPYTF